MPVASDGRVSFVDGCAEDCGLVFYEGGDQGSWDVKGGCEDYADYHTVSILLSEEVIVI